VAELSKEIRDRLTFAVKAALTFCERGQRDRAVGAVQEAVSLVALDEEESAEEIEWTM